MDTLLDGFEGERASGVRHVGAPDAPSRPTMRPTSRGPVVARDARVREALAVLDRVAPSACTVLITGESGTGKELLVAALHDASPRKDAPLVSVNCGANPSPTGCSSNRR